MKLIEKADIVSFDVFDTLISRDVKNENMIFKFMETIAFENRKPIKDFTLLRKEAEKKAMQKYTGTATIRQIYEELKYNSNLTDGQIEYLLRMEENLELILCFPKYEGRVLFEYCLWKNKKILLISDMYLSKKR